MRAILLAAGRGTRLQPHTDHIPKPLFPSGGIPIIDRLIFQLADQGMDAILINTHHLAELLENHIRQNTWPIPVFCRREKNLLDTGGAIANMKDFFTEDPMLILNADIRTDMDFSALTDFHLQKQAMATLVLSASSDMNHVAVHGERIAGFRDDSVAPECSRMAFTGIQMLSPEALSFFESGKIFSSIDAYRSMIHTDKAPFACTLPPSSRWSDLGTPERFSEAAMEDLLLSIRNSSTLFRKKALAGDGSDRKWWRIVWEDGKGCIIADHGIQGLIRPSEAMACASIAKHLADHIPVPECIGADIFAGLVAMEDLGDERLHDRILAAGTETTRPFYENLLALFPQMKKALSGFIPEMAFIFPAYNKNLILERECGYFKKAFLEDLLDLENMPEGLACAFHFLAEKTLEYGCTGLIHRDFQSRNIMILNEKIHIIDFQGAMQGPLQYDLASLLLDPYAGLAPAMQERLLEKCTGLMEEEGCCPHTFRKGYRYAALCRNLQILGAFSFLWKRKNKSFFKDYISPALKSLLMQKILEEPELKAIRDVSIMADSRWKTMASGLRI
ncbi:NDP-sugar pyrophosphorylase family protein [Desulfobotulus alkaliphilus]|uniref:NDP-sugar pyrophosphorylase family protein n=1 Tax=Desulfobotulus alkaliphilus TaxID=622671 RepID=A0A562RV54_9BACT|nr:sugar phosphate nucleotidyltransferase [Desulfobotulus alkaliphilus]TWI72246.1 NDP-sugar pyrophosphorylase family protein [Desulfobotulus alkaliphilus]